MAIPPKFAYTQTPKGWRISVPAAISDTGKRQQLFLPTREKAAARSKQLREQYRANGEQATILPPRVADDALRAWQMLEPHGVSLTEAARRMVAELDVIARSVSVAFAVDEWTSANKIKTLRKTTLASYKLTVDLILPKIGEQIIATVKAPDLMKIIAGPSYDMHRRNLSALWHWCAKPARQWCHADEFKGVEIITKKNDADIATLTPRLVRDLLLAAEKYFPETVCIYAIGFFGGVRVEERGKLGEDHLTEDGVAITKDIAKKRRRRHIPMNDTLKAWLEKYPFAPCPNWIEKDIAVRRLAGWDVQSRILKKSPQRLGLTPEDIPPVTNGKWPHNVIRHTHASAEVALGASMEDLLFRFGHTNDIETLRSHYVGRLTRKQAIEIVGIGPHNTRVPLTKVA